MKRLILLMVSVVLLTTFALPYSYDDSAPEADAPKYYDDAKVLRVKYTQGEAFVRRSYEDAMEEAVVNLPIFEKDVAGTTDGRLEVYLGRLNYLRLDYDSEVQFNAVPQLRKTDMAIRVIKGGIYLDIENLDFERDIEIQTPDCGVFLLDKGVYRINVNEGGRTEIYVYDGVAEVAGDNYDRKIRENQKMVMFRGNVKERPFYFYASDSDDFDMWSQERNNTAGYARYSSSRYLDEGYEDYEYELSRNGRWRYDSEYGRNVWIPYNVGTDWRPYYNGRWVWNPHYGYTWTSYDSWGHFTHHYGRWHWDPVSHWYWIPGYRWSPAWVHWFWDDYHYGWCASSWWNRPVIVYNGRWWRNHHYRGGFPTHARSSIIVKKGHLRASMVSKVAIKSRLAKKSLAYRGGSPKIRQHTTKVNVINARGKKVVFKKGGLVSAGKYKVTKTGPMVKQKTGGNGVTYKYSGKSVSKKTVSRYSKSKYTKGRDTLDRTTSSKSYTGKTLKHKQSTTSRAGGVKKYGSSSSSSSSDKKATRSSGVKYKPRTYTGSSGSRSSSKKYTSGKSSSKSRTKSSVSKSKSSKSSSKSKSSKSSSKSSSSKVKKKKESPYYSSSYSSGSSGRSSSSYSSPRTKSSNSYKSYKPSSSYKTPTRSKSYSSSSTKSRSSSSYKSSYGSSSKSYSKPSSSYKSSYKPSSSSRSYSKPSSSYKSSYKSSSKSYSKPRSSSKSSYKSSSKSSSSKSRSSSSSKSSSSSSKSYKKKK